MILLTLLLSFLGISTGTVYHVTPDDHPFPNITCHHCHNLQHYLLNVTKYFTSNTQLLFLPGIHHLDFDITIQDVNNISLIGNDATLVSTVYYSKAITIIDSSMITIKNFVFSNSPSMYFENSYYVSLHNITNGAIKIHNVMGKSVLSNITGYGISIEYDDRNTVKSINYDVHKLIIYNHTIQKGLCYIRMVQCSYGVSIIIVDSIFNKLQRSIQVFIADNNCATHRREIIFDRIQFCGNSLITFNYILNILFTLRNHQYFNETHTTHTNKVNFNNCVFANNRGYGIISAVWLDKLNETEYNIIIKECFFVNNIITRNVLSFYSHDIELEINIVININGSKFLHNTCYPYCDFGSMKLKSHFTAQTTTVIGSNIRLQLIGPTKFHDNRLDVMIMGSNFVLHNNIKFSHNKGRYMISASHILLMQPVTLCISKNNVPLLFYKNTSDIRNDIFSDVPLCYFQFLRNTANEGFEIIINVNYSIAIFDRNTQNVNCKLLPGSVFYKQNPLHLYQHFIHIQNDLGQHLFHFNTGLLCYCSKVEIQNCEINTVGPIFPGQTLTISLSLNYLTEAFIKTTPVSVDMYSKYLTMSHCKVILSNQILKWITRNCTQFHFAILSNNEQQCELFLNAKEYKYITIFYVKLLKCPIGFSFDISTERCECDVLMNSKLLTIRDCNINDQSILRPANSWISADTHNYSYVYDFSPSCPFHYCLLYSSYLNFSTQNSQCQFNRSGLLCGQCLQNLSTVFGSPNCQLCSSVYLLLIIPFTIAGILLVFILFFVNLTVTDGIINAFIMYTNIISINDHVFFTDTRHDFIPVYTFISLANLDLGIQTCFYNGMDDYAKMWLQLAFPFYLIFIATLLIITSRYSITVQRLTARRALPVLATLFLLSYTKILRTVSSVLFSYSTITHLPSKHTTVVWSVDANVPLFGIKFTTLFIVCLILFHILIPFNIILLFTRTSSRFQFINKFKPLLDAYQGPYKLKFYYWTGLQLLIKALFFGTSALDNNTNLTIGSIILSVMISLHGAVHPFKSIIKNYSEFLYIINLQVLYILTLSDYQGVTSVNVMVTVAALQFIFIIIYHIITYSYSGMIRIKINYFTNAVTTWISKLNKPSNVNLQLHNIEIPEVTYNYREFREPLIGQD